MNLKQAREQGKIDEFIRERESQAPAAKKRFQKLIKSVVSKTEKPKRRTSRKGFRGS